MHLMEICKVHPRNAFKMCIREVHPRSACRHCRPRTMAFVSELGSANCTLRHVYSISSKQLGQRYFMYWRGYS